MLLPNPHACMACPMPSKHAIAAAPALHYSGCLVRWLKQARVRAATRQAQRTRRMWQAWRRLLQMSWVVALSRPVEICRQGSPGGQGCRAEERVQLPRGGKVRSISRHAHNCPMLQTEAPQRGGMACGCEGHLARPCWAPLCAPPHLVSKEHILGPHEHLARRHPLLLPAADAADHGVALCSSRRRSSRCRWSGEQDKVQVQAQA